MGRPSDYSQELADLICAQLAEGTSLRTVCLAEGMPDKSTVFRWFRTQEGFCDQYARAREASADALVEQMLDIADNGGLNDTAESVARSRLMVDTRKWVASKLKAKKYGDKIENTHQGPDGGPMQFAPWPLPINPFFDKEPTT